MMRLYSRVGFILTCKPILLSARPGAPISQAQPRPEYSCCDASSILACRFACSWVLLLAGQTFPTGAC